MELKKYRRIAGLTQQQLGTKAGVDHTLISRLERGKHTTASYETIVRLARALNLEPEELYPVLVTSPVVPTDEAKGAA